ncbi:TPA: phage tail protein [Vibrio parahaemolyticus]
MANSTDKSILTAAGKALLAQLNAEEKALVIDKMIFANVPNRPEYPQPDDVVPTDHIVHQEQVEQRGRLSADSVIYSTTLTSDVGPFDFNWTGAYCSEYGVLVTIDHHALTPKTADEPGVAGNTLVRSVVLEYKDIAEITNITVDASSWQYNATERMKKMDSDVAQSIIDQNGKDWFIEDGFLVTPSGSAYSIKAGAGYVSGNRVAMEFDRSVQVPNKPSFIYIDAHREGTPTGEQVTLFNFVVTAEEKDDYIDSSTGKDIPHYVCKIAEVLADGSVSNLRTDGKGASKAYVGDISSKRQMAISDGNKQIDMQESIYGQDASGIDRINFTNSDGSMSYWYAWDKPKGSVVKFTDNGNGTATLTCDVDNKNSIFEFVSLATLNGRISADPAFFGAKFDGSDDLEALRLCLAVNNKIEMKGRDAYVQPSTSTLKMPDNSSIEFSGGSIRALPTNLPSFKIIDMQDAISVTLKNGSVTGERYEHLGESGEHGHNIDVSRSIDCTLENMKSNDAWGDGLYLGGSKDGQSSGWVQNLKTENCEFNNNRRNDVSVVSAKGWTSINDTFKKANGTPPEFGIDFEPNYPFEFLQDIQLINPKFSENENSAVGFAIDKLAGGGNPVSITIDNPTDRGSLFAAVFNSARDIDGFIKIRSLVGIEPIKSCVTFKNWEVSAPIVEIDGLHCVTNHSRKTDIIGDSPVSFQMPNGRDGGNIEIKNISESFAGENDGTGYVVAFQSVVQFKNTKLSGVSGEILNQHALSYGSKLIDEEVLEHGGNFSFPFVDRRHVNIENQINNGNQQVGMMAVNDSNTEYSATVAFDNTIGGETDGLTLNAPPGESFYPLSLEDAPGKLVMNKIGQNVRLIRKNARWQIKHKNY